MPHEDPEWDMSDEDRLDLTDKITGSHFAGLEDPQNPADIRRMQDRYGKDNMIRWLSGTDDKSSRQWKSARDGLSRRRTGRGGIGRLWRDKFRTAGRAARNLGIRARGSLNVRLTADVKVSSKWDRGRPMYATLTGPDLEEYLSALEHVQIESAAAIVAEEYGIPSESITEIANISGYEADIPEDDGEDDDA